MKGFINFKSAATLRQVVPGTIFPPYVKNAKTPQYGRRSRMLSTRKDDGAAGDPAKGASVPSVVRRTALLGAAAPCLCALCGGGAAKAAGRNPLYDRYFATAMRYAMDEYEAIIRPVKNQLFGEFVQGLLARDEADGAAGGTRRVLEVGVGTGPNFPFYMAALAQAATQSTGAPEPGSASSTGGPSEQPPSEAARPPLLHIVGLDPNTEMLRFAAEAAKAAGMQLIGSSGSGDIGSSDSGGGDGAAPGGVVPSVAEVSLVQGGAEALPFGDGEFDAAVVTLVMCSVPSPAAALGELHRVVRPGGRLLIIEHVSAGEGRPVLRLAQSLLTPLQRLVADGCSLNRDTSAVVRAAGWQQGELRSFDLEGLTVLAPHIAGLLVR